MRQWFVLGAGGRYCYSLRTHERTIAGLAAARARGRLGGRPKSDPKAIKQAIALYNAKTIPIKDILERTGISRATLYSYLRKRNGNL